MKKKNSKKSTIGDFTIFQCVVLYDDIHKKLENELLDLEYMESMIDDYRKTHHPSDSVDSTLLQFLIVHQDIENNINNLLNERLHSDK